MSVSLDDLDSRFRPLADRLLAALAAAGFPARVTYTLRTLAAQEVAKAQGRSKTIKSKHLPQPPDGKSLAIDVCPECLIGMVNYAPLDPRWWKVGEIGKALGLRWGGQWDRPAPPPVGQPFTDREFLWDPGHFEMRISKAARP